MKNCTSFVGDLLNCARPPRTLPLSLTGPYSTPKQNLTGTCHEVANFHLGHGASLSSGPPVPCSLVGRQQSRGPAGSFLAPLWFCRACDGPAPVSEPAPRSPNPAAAGPLASPHLLPVGSWALSRALQDDTWSVHLAECLRAELAHARLSQTLWVPPFPIWSFQHG